MGLIYASLWAARPAAEMLRRQGLLRLAVILAFVAAGAWILAAAARRRPGWRELAVLAAAAAVYVAALGWISIPEERIHLLEYGLVSALIYRALIERMRAAAAAPAGGAVAAPAVTAILATALLGWGDEGIQALLPNRVYDLRDVGFNFAAGVLAVLSLIAVDRARRRDGAV